MLAITTVNYVYYNIQLLHGFFQITYSTINIFFFISTTVYKIVNVSELVLLHCLYFFIFFLSCYSRYYHVGSGQQSDGGYGVESVYNLGKRGN